MSQKGFGAVLIIVFVVLVFFLILLGVIALNSFKTTTNNPLPTVSLTPAPSVEDFPIKVLDTKIATGSAKAATFDECGLPTKFKPQGYTITYSDLNLRDSKLSLDQQLNTPYLTKICIWTAQKQLKYHLSLDTYWGAASSSFPAGDFGMLPKQPEVFYAYTRPYQSDLHCRLYLINLADPSQKKTIELSHPKDEIEQNWCNDQKNLDLSLYSL